MKIISAIIKRGLFVASICFILMARTHGQVAGGTVNGTVTDTTGGVLPEVEIALKNLNTGVTTTAVTNSDGIYTVPNLLPGDYELKAGKANFSTAVAQGVNVTVGAEIQVNLVLKPGSVSDTVIVTSSMPQVDLQTSTLSSEVDSTTVRELPLNGRDWTQLATLEIGVAAIRQQPALSTGAARGNRGFGEQLTIGGSRPQQNNYRLDGVSINDFSNGAPGSVLGASLGVDAVQEFSVVTANYSAEYGRASGGIVNAITKSGTDAFHGTAYEFLRNSALDASNYFDVSQGPGRPAKPPFKRNQFGASGGFPIIKDRTFLFADYEGNRQSTGISQPIFVPTDAAWNGLTDGPVDPKVLAFRGIFPASSVPCTASVPDQGCPTAVVNQVINENYFTLRADHKLSSKDSLVGTYVHDNAAQTQPDSFNSVLRGNTTNRQIVTLEDTHTFTPTLINTVRFGLNHIFAVSGQNSTAINPLAADTSGKLTAISGQAAPAIAIGNGFTLFQGGVGGTPVYRFDWNSFQFYDDAFLTRGIHFIKFGFANEYIQDNLLAISDASGGVRFNSLADFFANRPAAFHAAFPGTTQERRIRQHIYAGYIQDDMRLKTNLTLNLGLRYEMSTVPTDTRGLLSTLLTPTDAQPHLGDPYFLNPTKRNFEPRIGFAWDPFKTGKTSVRGGFGMFDVLPLPYLFETLIPLASPFFQFASKSGLKPGTFPDGLFDQIKDAKYLRQSYIQHDPKRNYVMQWNLNVQREVVKNVSAMVAYVGSRTVHNATRADDINTNLPLTPLNAPGPIYPGYVATNTPTFLNPSAGQVSSMIWNGDAHYHGLQTKLTVRVNSRFQGQAAYTWSKAIDTGSATVGGDTFLNSISSLPFFNPALGRGPADFNIPHNLVISYMWSLPTPTVLPSPLKWITSGWQLGGIVQISSGVPFTATIDPNTDPLNLGSTDTWDFPDRLSGPGCHSLVNPGNVNHYIKTECLTIPTAPASFAPICSQQLNPSPLPPAGQITCTNRRGNLGRNSLPGPPLRNVDFSLFKNIPVRRISEDFNIQFRAELFNIFNHPNFAPPVNNSAVFTQSSDPTQLDRVANAGQIDATVTTSRQIQFGLKFVW